MNHKVHKLAILNSHPIQYFAPLYRRFAQENRIDLTVYFCSRQGVEPYMDSGFGETVQWGSNLLEGYTYKFLPNIRQSGRVAGFFSLVNPGIIDELRQGQFDALLIHGHNLATNQMAIVAARLFGIPLLMRSDTHLLLQRSPLKKLLRRPIMSLFYRNCAVCLAIGTRNADFYRYHGVPNKRIALIPYAVNNDYFIAKVVEHQAERQAIRSELGLAASTAIILYASKLVPGKNPMHLLKAYQRLQIEGVDSALVFVGSGSELSTLQSYIANNDVGGVHFIGFQNQSELPKFYAVADVFVLPASNEAWGLVINEVMCAGLPVVVTDEVGAVPDLVRDGENGFVFRVGDIDTLAKHLKTLCTDTNMRKHMGEASLRIIRNWSYEEDVRSMLEVLDELSL
jgi:glycosyltransferase involved in cell wall biosynthesis